MKHYCLFLFFMILSGTSKAQVNREIQWHDMSQALEMSQEDAKPLFIEFTARWCGWCKKMDKSTFQEKKVVRILNTDYYAVKLNFDSREAFEFQGMQYTAKELAKEYGVEGLPTIIVLSKDMTAHSLIVGYQSGRQLQTKLSQIF